jgi:hypothetical protein
VTTTADVAAAVVADLTATAFSQAFTAERAYLPIIDLGAMMALHVTVVAAGRTVQPASRTSLQVEHRIEIAVQQKLASEDPTACDPLLGLVGEIADHLSGHHLAGAPDAAWVRTEHAPLVDPGHLNELRQFTSLITVTYRTWGS